MNFLSSLAYLLTSVAAGAILILAGSGRITPEAVNNILQAINSSYRIQSITLLSGLLVILL